MLSSPEPPPSADTHPIASTSSRALSDRECLPIGLQILVWFSLNLLCLVGSALLFAGINPAHWPLQAQSKTPCWISASLLVCSVLFWIPLFLRITRPIRRMQRAAQALARGNFHIRVPVERRDELGSLALSLNELAAQLEGVLASKHQFLADIAHELGSPLARMQWALSIVENKADPAWKPELEDIREEVAQMASLLEELLNFSKNTNTPQPVLEPVSLRCIVNDALQQEEAPCEKVDLSRLMPVNVEAIPHLLKRALANVIRNAMRYAPDGGPLRIETSHGARGVTLRLTDDGPGVDPADLASLGEPFFRPESTRSLQIGGMGLGLSIVKRCIESCKGTVSISNAQPRGLCVEINLREAKPA